VLVITNNEGNDVTILWNRIKKIGEIVLLGGTEGQTTPSQSGQIGMCSKCGFVNKQGSRFCEECGTKI